MIKQIGHLFYLLYRIGLQLAVISIFILVVFLALFYTNPGAKLSIGLANLFSPYPIKTQSIEGTLAGPLTLKNARIESPDISLSADSITANWAQDAFEFFRTHKKNNPTKQYKNIHLKQFSGNNIRIIYHNKENTDSFKEIPNLATIHQKLQEILPINLIIEDFEIKKISLHLSEKPINIQSITFTRGASHQANLFKTLSIQAEQGTLFFNNQDNRIHLKWDFKIPELNHLIPDLKGDLITQGSLKLKDINVIDNEALMSFNLKSNQLSYLDNLLENVKLEASGNLEKHHVDFEGKINDHQLNTKIIGTLDQATKTNWKVELKDFNLIHKRLGKLPSSTGKIDFKMDALKNNIQALIQTNILGKNPISAQFDIVTNQPTFPLLGKIQGKINDLDFLVKLFPILEDVTGEAALNLNVKGDLFDPIVWGNIALKNITIDTNSTNYLGTTLHLSTLNLNSSGDGKLAISGKGTMGKGNFTVEGLSDFTQDSPQVDLSLKGTRLTLSQTPEYFIIANPDLRLQLKNNTPQLTGTLFIPEAEIETQTFGSEHVEPSSDIVIINPVIPNSNTPMPSIGSIEHNPLITNINVELGDKVQYKGFGLKSHFAGKLNIFTQNSNVHARGKLTLVNGKYRTHGNTLDIQHGQIAFLGDQLMNPTWDIRATKTIYAPIQNKFFQSKQTQNETALFESKRSTNTINTMATNKPILVGISLKGTVRAPSLNMFSSPKMPDADIISYLVLNKPQKDASNAQTTLVVEATNELINFLGNKRSDVKMDLAKNLKLDTFGLSQVGSLNPGQRDFEQTAVVIGKQLSKKLYAEYSLRMLDNASALSLRYLVGKHITLEGSASKESASGDLLFTFESG